MGAGEYTVARDGDGTLGLGDCGTEEEYGSGTMGVGVAFGASETGNKVEADALLAVDGDCVIIGEGAGVIVVTGDDDFVGTGAGAVGGDLVTGATEVGGT